MGTKRKVAGRRRVKHHTKKLTVYDIAESIKTGFAEVKLIGEGKLKPITLEELLNKL